MKHETEAYVAVSPRGNIIQNTMRPTADLAWGALRALLSDSDSLHKSGWRVHRIECALMEVAE